MDLQLSETHLKFRDQLRAWLEANMGRPWREELRDPNATEDSLIELRRTWQRKLYEAGYLGIDWPVEWGGRGATEVEKSNPPTCATTRRRASTPQMQGTVPGSRRKRVTRSGGRKTAFAGTPSRLTKSRPRRAPASQLNQYSVRP